MAGIRTMRSIALVALIWSVSTCGPLRGARDERASEAISASEFAPSNPATRGLAEQAIRQAFSMARRSDRDHVLRDVSRNLRHAHPDLALAAANGMVEDSGVFRSRIGPIRP